MVGLLKEDDIPIVALQEFEQPAPLVFVLEAADVNAEQAQGGLSEAQVMAERAAVLAGPPSCSCSCSCSPAAVAADGSTTYRRAG